MLSFESLTKDYGSTRAVDDVSFTVSPGRVTGFLGPNGAGKSTCMRLLLGLDRPTQGRALVDGVPYAKLPRPLEVVGGLLDPSWVYPKRSGRDHLLAIAATHRIPSSRVDEVLETVGLTPAARRQIGGYSLGMRQRLGIGAAILSRPGHLVLDEPVNGLDPDGVIWVRDFLRDYAATGRTVLLSSHLLAEMAHTADDIVVIARGRIVAQGPMTDLLSQGPAARVSSDDDAALTAAVGRDAEVTRAEDGALLIRGLGAEEVGRIACREGIPLRELGRLSESLESAFLKLVAGEDESAQERITGQEGRS